MSNFDNLIKGLQVFDQGMTQYAIGTSVKDATQQVAELNAKNLNDADKLNEQNAISQRLASRLTAAGAEPGQIAAMTERIAPSMGAQYQAQQNQALQQKSQDFQVAQNATEMSFKSGQAAESNIRETQRIEEQNKFTAGESARNRKAQMDLAKLKLEQSAVGAGIKKDARQVDMDLKQQDKFRTQNKNQFDALDAANGIQDLLSPDAKDRVDSSQVHTALIKLNRAAGDTKVSDKDIVAAAANQSARSRVARQLGITLAGEALKDDVQFYSAIGDRLKERITGRLHESAKAFSKGYASTAQYTPEQAAHFESNLIDKYALSGPAKQQRTDAAGNPVNEAGVVINPNKGKQPSAAPSTQSAQLNTPAAQRLAQQGARIQQSADGKQFRIVWPDGKTDILSKEELGD